MRHLGSAASRCHRTPTAVLASVAAVSFLALGISVSEASSPLCRDKAKDLNHDGEIDADEAQECGGQDIGTGGTDGADLPHVPPGSHRWSNFHWSRPSGDERKVIIRDSTTDTWDGRLTGVLSDWGDSSRFRFTKQQAATSSDERLSCSMPGNYGRVRICNHSDYSLGGFAGEANIRVNSEGHIQRGRVRVLNSVSTDARRALLCQEVGHTLGLAHRSSTGSCMLQNASAAAPDPDSHDFEELRDITHSHGGETETGGLNSDLDIGGGILDGCDLLTLTCTDVSSHGTEGYTVSVGVLKRPPSGWIGLRPVL